jgi:hypothetical protein
MPYQLRITEYEGEDRWRWVLEDERGTFVADHEVDLREDHSQEHRAFRDLPEYLWRYRGIREPDEVLGGLGSWMGAEVFGSVGEALAQHLASPAK